MIFVIDIWINVMIRHTALQHVISWLESYLSWINWKSKSAFDCIAERFGETGEWLDFMSMHLAKHFAKILLFIGFPLVSLPKSEYSYLWNSFFLFSSTSIPHICHRRHRRRLCKNFLPGVILFPDWTRKIGLLLYNDLRPSV